MDSTNLQPKTSSPPPPLSSSYAVAGTTTWTPNITLNNNNNAGNFQEANNTRSRSSLTHRNNNMIQDLGYHDQQWRASDSSTIIKEEISFANFPKFTQILSNNSTMEEECYHQMKNNINDDDVDEHKDMNDLMLNTLFSTNYHHSNVGGIISSQIHPSINISNLNHYSSSSAFDMNMQSLDLLTPTSFTTTTSQHHLAPTFTHHSFPLHPPIQHHPTNMPSNSNSNINKPSLLSNCVGETKRGMESKASQSQMALKKPRSSSESRPSCPPFKVRKEKLGDRIAALQQMVAPFGKTDTASVLMEAIGYIKFLQGQVETLSVPYMKSSHKQKNRSICDTSGEAKQDLRSRGLCLVPLSYIAGVDGGGEVGGGGIDHVWPQFPNFGGGPP